MTDDRLADSWHAEPAPRPVDALGKADLILLLAIRWWVRSRFDGQEPIPRLAGAMRRGGVANAAASIDLLMAVVARTARRAIDIRCPRCGELSEDEGRLLQAAHLVQRRRSDLAQIVLRLYLITPRGAGFAIGPLNGVATLFSAAGLRFTPSTPPAGLDDPCPTHSACGRLLH